MHLQHCLEQTFNFILYSVIYIIAYVAQEGQCYLKIAKIIKTATSSLVEAISSPHYAKTITIKGHTIETNLNINTTNLRGGVLLAIITSLALPARSVFNVCLYPKQYFPLFITIASRALMFSVDFFYNFPNTNEWIEKKNEGRKHEQILIGWMIRTILRSKLSGHLNF